MFKKIVCIALMLCTLAAFTACGEKKILHCDGCGKEVKVDADSNMDEEWIIFCSECDDALNDELN